jgi:hypothetical protein
VSKPTTYQQYLLQNGTRYMHCWLPNSHGELRVGNTVKLKKVEGQWQVKHVYLTMLTIPPYVEWKVGEVSSLSFFGDLDGTSFMA